MTSASQDGHACGTCGEHMSAELRFCPACGAAATQADGSAAPIAVAPVGGLPCPNCGVEISAGTAFCRRCGTSVTGEPPPPRRSLPSSGVLVGVGVAVAVLIIVGFAFALTRGGGDSTPASGDSTPAGSSTPSNSGTPTAAANIFEELETQPLSQEALAAFAAAVEDLPDPEGDTEAEKLHSLLGQPDVFVLEFEDPDDGGPRQRFETWSYLELGMSYDFMDGVLLYAFPIDEPPALTLIPLRYDPLDFSADTTVDDIRAMMFDPESLVAEQPPEEYLAPYPVWAGEQLMAQFDGDGALFYVETIPLGPGE